MRAFAHPPRHQFLVRGDATGCFVYEALGYRQREDLSNSSGAWALSHCYEWEGQCCSSDAKGDNAWLYGECVRELAERGVAVEPQVAQLV